MMSAETVRAYLDKAYGRVVSREPDGRFSAYVLEWPGCYGQGDTAADAHASLEASMEAWLEVMLEDGSVIPEPLARDYSGNIMLRLPRELHRRVAIRSAAEGVSANQFISGAIEARLASQTHNCTVDAANDRTAGTTSADATTRQVQRGRTARRGRRPSRAG